ncbi:hypothetical protein PM10SUCC1_30940 [Propionigenium maris DSM 9537]|jgi:hypothetical protein|uniref:Uncharacterized protein n=1 Tax=Propionigenium maris DSM 9537 TaxID=1123000 RepID=A0A9W6GNW0_9FUSO|nr:hypothetical protein [Propionigenium maris]GLI57580.1 hypothetical protein PM10SUCC1_30940 [Propionigenium maris DSM 9537]
MFELVSFILVFIEKSISFDYPYNFIAVPFLTYLVYRKGVEAFWGVLLLAFLVSMGSITMAAATLVGIFYYVVFYLLSTFMAYEKINLPLITAIQAVTYSGFVYYGSGIFSLGNFGKLVVAYAIFNYLYMDNGEKLFGVK